jgi:hypothetical protein
VTHNLTPSTRRPSPGGYQYSQNEVIYVKTRHAPGLPSSLLLLTLGVGLLAMFAGRLGMLLGRG